jgi:hypothetical protein
MASAQPAQKSLSVNSGGSHILQFGLHKSIRDVFSHWGYSVMFDKMKNRNGWAVGFIFGQSGFKQKYTGYPVLNDRESVNVYVNYIRQIRQWKKAELNAFAGLASKYSNETIILYNRGIDGRGSAVLDRNGYEFGGLATNVGLNAKYQLRKRLFLNASARTINYWAFAGYQTQGFFTEIGLGWRLGKLP